MVAVSPRQKNKKKKKSKLHTGSVSGERRDWDCVSHFWGRFIKIPGKEALSSPLPCFFFLSHPDCQTWERSSQCSYTYVSPVLCPTTASPLPYPCHHRPLPRPHLPLPHHAQGTDSSPCLYFLLLTPLTGTERIQTRSHESAKKATLQIRFVIIGGGAAGLSCAVALRRVGHQVIVLEKGPDFIGVRTTPVPSP